MTINNIWLNVSQESYNNNNKEEAIYSQLSIAKKKKKNNVKVAIYSQLSLAKKR